EAAYVAQDPRSSNAAEIQARPRVADVIAWAAAIGQIRATADEYYRNRSLGKSDGGEFRSSLDKVCKRAWKSFSWPKKPASYSTDAFTKEIDKRFKAVARIGMTGSDLDLHLGHRVMDEQRTVKQYGHSADLRFILLDGIVSNGYRSWVADGRSQ